MRPIGPSRPIRAPIAVAGTYALLSHSPFTNASNGSDYQNASIYQAQSGAWVFGSGTMGWSWGLDDYGRRGALDTRIQLVTANILNRFIAGSRRSGVDARVRQSQAFPDPAARCEGDKIVRAKILLNGEQVKNVSGKALRLPIDLRGLPKGRFVVEIHTTDTAGKQPRPKAHISDVRAEEALIRAGRSTGRSEQASQESRPSTSRRAAATRSTCASVISGKNGSASERAATSSQTGNSPSRWPKRSR